MAPWSPLFHSMNRLKMGTRLMSEGLKTMRELLYWGLFLGHPARKTNYAGQPPCRPPRATCILHCTKGRFSSVCQAACTTHSVKTPAPHSTADPHFRVKFKAIKHKIHHGLFGHSLGLFFYAYYSLILDHRGLVTTLSPSFTGQRGEAAQGHSVY